MSKDQALGALIFLVCIVVAIGYIAVIAFPEQITQILNWLPWNAYQIQFGAVAVVVLLAFLAIMFIGAWIGWTMATTPPPKPIEELETEGLETSEKEGEKAQP